LDAIKSPLQGIKVADFSWSVVGPTIATYLSYYGAEVVKVESIYSPEVTRRSAPYKNGVVDINHSLPFLSLNTNKYSLCLNLKHAKGLEVALKLVSWADVIIQSATNSTLNKLGLNYSAFKKVNPDIIALNTSNQGETGPYCNHPGYGDAVVAMAGFPEVTGWADRDPSIPPGAYTDAVTPWFGCLAVLAALEYRNQTGLGQHIDLAQLEVAQHMLRPEVLSYSVNNVVWQRNGNRSLIHAPHSVYRCSGDNRWCAFAITTEDEWKAFCWILGNPDWTKDAKFAVMADRKKNEDELDSLIESWTMTLKAEEVMERLQTAGIASGVVKNIGDLHEDPQLIHRGNFAKVTHPEIGDYTVELPPARFSQITADLRRSAPCMGEHTEYVCCTLLGISGEEFVQLDSDGVFK
jgi:benzylsuccinate CoA-transferase BbsF subunit